MKANAIISLLGTDMDGIELSEERLRIARRSGDTILIAGGSKLVYRNGRGWRTVSYGEAGYYVLTDGCDFTAVRRMTRDEAEAANREAERATGGTYGWGSLEA